MITKNQLKEIDWCLDKIGWERVLDDGFLFKKYDSEKKSYYFAYPAIKLLTVDHIVLSEDNVTEQGLRRFIQTSCNQGYTRKEDYDKGLRYAMYEYYAIQGRADKIKENKDLFLTVRSEKGIEKDLETIEKTGTVL